MTVFKLIGKLLKFKGFRCNGLAFRRGNRLDVLVKPYKNGCRCPHCGRRGTIIRQPSEARFWRDIPVGPWSVWLMCWPREIHCDTHGRVTEQLPWAEAGARVSHRFEYLMLRYCQIMPLSCCDCRPRPCRTCCIEPSADSGYRLRADALPRTPRDKLNVAILMHVLVAQNRDSPQVLSSALMNPTSLNHESVQ